MLSLKDLLRTSRPLLWLNTAVLWLLGLLVLDRPPTLADGLMILYFTFPFNLWLHGINDVYDYESDLLNERKGSDEGALLPRETHRPMLRALLLWNLPVWLGALLIAPPLAVALLTLFLALGWAYSAPPVRAKSRPFLDGLVNSAYLLPYAIALAWHGAAPALWSASLPALLAFAAWSIASHAFTSIQDIEADRAAGVATVATFLGPQRAARFSLLGYGIALLLTAPYGAWWVAAVGIYPALVLWFLASPGRARANRLYRWFILLNSSLGFAVTVTLALANPANTLWAAVVVVGLVALVALALRWGRYGGDGVPGTAVVEG